jgi:hypothetical protein
MGFNLGFKELNKEIFHRFYDKPTTFKSTIPTPVKKLEKVRNKALLGMSDVHVSVHRKYISKFSRNNQQDATL